MTDPVKKPEMPKRRDIEYVVVLTVFKGNPIPELMISGDAGAKEALGACMAAVQIAIAGMQVQQEPPKPAEGGKS